MTIDTYPPEQEDLFGNSRLSNLDTWVFDKVKSFFSSARENVDLQMELRKTKSVFFLHLLGCDSNGHAHRPHSKEYQDNALIVDKGISEMVVKVLMPTHKAIDKAMVMA